METEKSLPSLRAGRYCTSDSKYSFKAFIRAAQIYRYLVRSAGGGISWYPGRKLLAPLLFEDFSSRSPRQIRERREALVLLFDTLKQESMYKEMFKNKKIFPEECADYRSLATLLLHDMLERSLTPGVCKYYEDAVIANLEQHFNENRMEIWKELSKIKSSQGSTTLISPRFETLKQSQNAPLFLWVDIRNSKSEEVAKHFRQLGYEARLAIRGLDSMIDTPNVIKITNIKSLKIFEESIIMDNIAVIDDIANCVAPHCFLNALQYIEREGSRTSNSDVLNKSPENSNELSENFDVLITEAGNGLTVAHLAILLQSSGFTGKILVFDGGSDKEIARCKRVQHEMKIHKVYFYSEKLPDLWILDKRLQKVKAAYVNPMCSKSAVSNPIPFLSTNDTDFEFLAGIYHSRSRDVTDLAMNQIKTLKFCMMIQGMQLILYTTNSANFMENDQVIQTVMGNSQYFTERRYRPNPTHENSVSEPQRTVMDCQGPSENPQSSNDYRPDGNDRNALASNMLFELLRIPVCSSAFVKSSYQRISVSPTNEQNGYFITALRRR